MDHTDSDNVKPTDEYYEVHNVDESERLVGQLFSLRDQAWEQHGLTWKGTTRLDVEGNVKTQEFCCSKEGFRVSKVNTVVRQRAHRPVTKTGCKARVIVTNKYKRSVGYKAVCKTDIDEATTLKEVGVGTSQVMNYLMQQAGGYHNIGFIHKDVYNALQRGKAKEIVNEDVNALIAYFDYKKHDDPEFFMTYSVDELWALHNLIWLDSTSRSDYTCFGDVIVFDTMYKDNLYGRPIMPIVGVNHHHNIIVFSTAIIAVVTDGDRAMQRAIKSVIPYAKHILCSWHLSRNVQANIGDPKFTAAFSKYMASWWTTEEFDIQWCEYMNSSLAIALKHKKTYLDVVRAIEDGISRMRMNELKADYLSSQTKPFQIKKLVDLESHDAEIFTREYFHAFQDELQRETLYRIQEEIQSLSDECQHYILTKKFETIGLPCRHQLHILKHLDYTYFPGTLIQSRWTKDAKASAPNFVDLNVPPEVMQMARFATLRSTSSRFCYIASKKDTSFKTEKYEMKRLTEEFENSFGLNDSVNQSSVVNNVRDPQRKQSKRKEVPKNKVEKKIRQCGYCNGEGHNKLTCPQVNLSLNTSTQLTSTDFFEDEMEWPFSPARDDNNLHIS
ncbi:hypothetical protein F3Y22_tig00110925pilonHSYRG00015 [Hibiscus syriacus]|uniref:FAR1 domain-containing protein n=1 Tax=Hibiscus syriacus TaxID=106335 RepID=A0A6A2ZF33_HIBSY|nr:hypothetical protein F3Y22_tig00110925pilonHSYRG00015 [Hibiscus syriacus]